MGTPLERIDATVFNTVSDLFAVATRVALGVAIGSVYALLLSWHLRRGHSVPPDELGVVPGDFFGALLQAWKLAGTAPAVIVVLLLCVADFSHSVADLGLSFVSVQVEGNADTVLDLQTRNPYRLYHFAGDPPNLRTYIVPDLGEDINDWGKEEFDLAREQNDIMSAFVVAAESIARGISPFTTARKLIYDGYLNNNFYRWNDAPTSYVYSGGEQSLTEMNLLLPLECKSSEMTTIPLFAGYDNRALGETEFRTSARVPDCAYANPRSTGIFKNYLTGKAETMEFSYNDKGDGTFVQLGDDISYFDGFTATPEMKTLARDRDNWKEGRRIEGITRMRYGSLEIQLGTVVLAAGEESLALPVESMDGSVSWLRRNRHALIANTADGTCPSRPSGASMHEVNCFVYVELECDAFPEDFASVLNLDLIEPTVSQCEINVAYFIWGRGFTVDDDLLAVMSGLHGRIRPPLFGGNGNSRFRIHASQAALFAMGSLSASPANDDRVVPEINGLYVFFMIAPIFVGIVALLVGCCWHKKKLALPASSWDLLVLGREEKSLPRRQDKAGPFPEMHESYKALLVPPPQGAGRILTIQHRIGFSQSPPPPPRPHPHRPAPVTTTKPASNQTLSQSRHDTTMSVTGHDYVDEMDV